MAQTRSIVFSSHNIYTEGVVSRLSQHPDSGDIYFIDAGKKNFIAQVVDLDPDIVILDETEDGEAPCCYLCDLLAQLPSVTIIRLKVQNKDVQVISSSTHMLNGVADLIDLINGK